MTILNTKLTLNDPTFTVSIQDSSEELIDQLEAHPLELVEIGATVAQHTADPFEDWDVQPCWEIPLTFTCGTARHTEALEIDNALEAAIIESITPNSTITCKAEKSPGLYGKTWVSVTIQIPSEMSLVATGGTFTLTNGVGAGNGEGVNIT